MRNKLLKELEGDVKILKEVNESYSKKLHKIEELIIKNCKENQPEIYYKIHAIIYN